MNAQEIRNKYLHYMEQKGHTIIPRAQLIPQDDPTTLFTGSGMQPLVPYLLGQPHPKGTRLVDSQTCLRAQDRDEVGDNRHTTFFEMLGNWSLGDYFKKEQLRWFFEFLTNEIKLDPHRLYVTAFIGDESAGVPRDDEAAQLWQELFTEKGIDAKIVEIGSEADGCEKGMEGGRIFMYDAAKNWWTRAGKIADMPVGEIGGGDAEVFYEFEHVQHDTKWGKNCHPNCDCGRFVEIGNSVFMEYIKTESGFEKLPKQNVDFGGGLERIAQAAINSDDMFMISLLKPIIDRLEEMSGKSYTSHATSMRVVADHYRAAFWMAVDGVEPSNKEQGYVMRSFMRRAIRFAFELGVENDLGREIVPVITSMYAQDFPEVANQTEHIEEVLEKEEKLFRQTLRSGVREFNKLTADGVLTGEDMFKLHDTYGFPTELSLEEAYMNDIQVAENAEADYEKLMQEQRERSQTAGKGVFKGGLADHSDQTVKYHTATHLMYRALKNVLGDHVVQRGSNITPERLRFDFSHPEKMTPDQIQAVEDMVNEQIKKDWPMGWREENTQEALASGVLGAFGDRYGETVKVYTVGDPEGEHYSREICGGPHVEHTGVLAEDGKRFKILKEESSSSGVRRVKAALV